MSNSKNVKNQNSKIQKPKKQKPKKQKTMKLPNFLQLHDDILCMIISTLSYNGRQISARTCLKTYNAYIKVMVNEKISLIKKYVKSHSNLAPQGSAKWLDSKMYGYGGSEQSTLEGKNPRSDMKQLNGQKVGLPEYAFDGNEACDWGTVFEPNMDLVTECMFGTYLHELGSVPGLVYKNRVIQAYSMDGLGLVDKNILKKMVNITRKNYGQPAINDDEFDYLPPKVITLFEFKCPYSRKPQGYVPKYYGPQPMVGMVTINVSETSIFSEAVFRKCSIKDFDTTPTFDKFYHWSKGANASNPICMGFIGIYKDDSKYGDDYPEMYNRVTVGRYADSELEEFTEDEEADENVDEKKKMLQKLANKIAKDISYEIVNKKSDYKYVKIKFSHITSIIYLATAVYEKYKNSTYKKENITSDQDKIFTVYDSIKKLASGKFNYLKDEKLKIKKVEPFTDEELQLTKKMVTDSVLITSRLRNTYDMSDLDYGIDFGNTGSFGDECPKDEFNATMRLLASQRFKKGMKCYYPEGFYFTEENAYMMNSEKFKYDNYIDRTLNTNVQCKKWLYQNVEEFIKFCKQKDYQLIGIIPWKLMGIDFHLMYKDPNYIQDRLDLYKKHWNNLNKLHTIKNKMIDAGKDISKVHEKLRKELNAMYPDGKSRTSPAKLFRPKKQEKTQMKSILSQFLK